MHQKTWLEMGVKTERGVDVSAQGVVSEAFVGQNRVLMEQSLTPIRPPIGVPNRSSGVSRAPLVPLVSVTYRLPVHS